MGEGEAVADDYLTAREAAERLGVKLPTLYSYASRGLIESVPGSRARSRRYRGADVERLCARRDARAGHGPVAASALQWGEPVLDTSITSISDRLGPLYRGRAAVELADADVPFEAVVELLWNAEVPSPEDPLDTRPLDPRQGAGSAWRIPSAWRDLRHQSLGFDRDLVATLLPEEGASPMATLGLLIPLLAVGDPGRFGLSPSQVQSRARRLIRRMACGLAPGLLPAQLERAFRAETIAAAVAAALGAHCEPAEIRALDRALVLVADHELNASTFAARVAASTGADLYACAQAALATLSGPRHGGATDRVEALLAEVDHPGAAERVVHERRRRGEYVDGFGHPLYGAGDPRGRALMRWARELASNRSSVRSCFAVAEAVETPANLDFGLVTLATALGLPRGAAAGIFAVGRCAGWIAHVLEQYEAGYLVRPRARYTGPARTTEALGSPQDGEASSR